MRGMNDSWGRYGTYLYKFPFSLSPANDIVRTRIHIQIGPTSTDCDYCDYYCRTVSPKFSAREYSESCRGWYTWILVTRWLQFIYKLCMCVLWILLWMCFWRNFGFIFAFILCLFCGICAWWKLCVIGLRKIRVY